MIGSSRDREAIAALQETVATLSSQLATALSEISALAERHAEAVKKAETFEDTLTGLRDALDGFKGHLEERHGAEAERQSAIETTLQELLADRRGMALLIAANTEAIEQQTEQFNDLARLDDQIKQCRAMLVRLERQAESDLAELRETDSALASSLLRLGAPGAPLGAG